MENRDGAFVLQQRYIHHTLQGFKRSVFTSVRHYIERLSAIQELDAGQFRRRGVVEQLEDDVSLFGGIVRVQRLLVVFASRRSGVECGFQRLETCQGNPCPPATCALQIPRLTLGEKAVRRATK